MVLDNAYVTSEEYAAALRLRLAEVEPQTEPCPEAPQAMLGELLVVPRRTTITIVVE